MKKKIKILLIVLLISHGLLHAQTFSNYTTTDGLPDNFIIGGVAVDTNNNKWFGTVAGVAKFNDTIWSVYNTADGLIDNYTNCIAVDKSNNIWVGTNNGVSKYDGTTWTSFTTYDGLANNAVYSIAGDNNDNIWFGTYGYGVTKLNGTTWTTYTYADGLPGNFSENTAAIKSICVDAFGNKWFATNMGLVKYDDTTFTIIDQTTVGDSLLNDNITAVAIDENNNKWIGVSYNGMAQLNNSNNWVKNYRTTDGLYNDYIKDIKIDSQGSIWIGMFDSYNQNGGITKYDGTTWSSFSEAQGLVDKQIISIAIYKNDILWIATGEGVSKYGNFSSINEPDNIFNFNAFPNPVNSSLTIYLNTTSTQKLEIINIIGEKVYSCNSAPVIKINTEYWAGGIYIVSYGPYSKKVIVAH